ncbi:MAG: MBL fold metallo-hydrolase [Proteobacteria bacterium]|nr:MBL fold metallo-hydrolase [Pseudomonadota bacterium]
MKHSVNITVLAEEMAHGLDLIAEHSWAVWIETNSRHVLFDVGQGAETALNARTLNIDLRKCDTIVLSHGHYDHTGGLVKALSMAPDSKIYAHPIAFEKKYALNNDGTSRYNGMPRLCREVLGSNPRALIKTLNPTDLGSGLWVTGEIPRKTKFEDAGGAYFVDPQCSKPDPIRDDQALFFESSHGLVVILGCAHAGAINTIEYVCKLADSNKIHAVLGGMHLIHASDDRVQSTIESLEYINPDFLGLSHCTGVEAAEKIKATFRQRCLECIVGTQISFD